MQTGVGLTGRFSLRVFGHPSGYPAAAKGIGGGFPLGVCMATADAAKGLTAGVHGTTFGGNPLAMAIGNAVVDMVLAPGFIEIVAGLGCWRVSNSPSSRIATLT